MAKTLEQDEKQVHVADIVRHGEKLIVPDGMKLSDVLDLVKRRMTFEEEEVIPLSEVAQELTEVKAEIESSYQSLFGLLNELEGTTDKSKSELSKFISLLSK